MQHPAALGVSFEEKYGLKDCPKAPSKGWRVKLMRNYVLGEMVPQIPPSDIIQNLDVRNADEDHEWHFIIHDIAENLDEHYQKIGLQIGDRVTLSGNAGNAYFNGKKFWLFQMSSIQSILYHGDDKFVGSKFGKDALNPEG